MCLLADEVYQTRVAALLSQSFLHVHSWAEAWDTFKLQLRECAAVQSSAISYEARREQRDLPKRLAGLLRLECECPGRFEGDIAEARGKFDAFERRRYEGAAVRARARTFVSSDAPSKSSIADERKHARLSEIVELEIGGSVTTGHAAIQEALRSRYVTILGCSVEQGREVDMAELLRLVPRLDVF